MKLHNLDKLIANSKKRIGRGIGSGKGKTSARGTKGQKARGKIPASFIGGSLPLYKKLPFLRGWGNRKARLTPMAVSMDDLNRFKANTTITSASFVEIGMISEAGAKKRGIKILNRGTLTVKGLTIELPMSAKVKSKIESVGGKVA